MAKRFIVPACLFLAIAGCPNWSAEEPDPCDHGLGIVGAQSTLAAGDSLILDARRGIFDDLIGHACGTIVVPAQWQSSHPAVATVDARNPNLGTFTMMLHAHAPGSTQISASANGQTASFALQVTP